MKTDASILWFGRSVVKYVLMAMRSEGKQIYALIFSFLGLGPSRSHRIIGNGTFDGSLDHSERGH